MAAFTDQDRARDPLPRHLVPGLNPNDRSHLSTSQYDSVDNYDDGRDDGMIEPHEGVRASVNKSTKGLHWSRSGAY